MRIGQVVTAAAVAVTLTGGALCTAPAAVAAEKCTTSSKSLDMPQYSGPWPDNWDFTVKVCARRSGSNVSAWARVEWNAPTSAEQVATFDAARVRVQVKRSQSGTDPMLKSGTYDFRSRAEDGDGSYTSGTVTAALGKKQGLGDAELLLDWNNDGEGEAVHLFSATPAV
ncbi:hypothetical protein [Streptomyces sp. NPDC049879]|uniref:hypothetical protein n=1 Tax=Streptomyces sp. NPDC049879 TaxID=3365598 RepID=UPI0037BE1640